jgi:hypothetical protein
VAADGASSPMPASEFIESNEYGFDDAIVMFMPPTSNAPCAILRDSRTPEFLEIISINTRGGCTGSNIVQNSLHEIETYALQKNKIGLEVEDAAVSRATKEYISVKALNEGGQLYYEKHGFKYTIEGFDNNMKFISKSITGTNTEYDSKLDDTLDVTDVNALKTIAHHFLPNVNTKKRVTLKATKKIVPDAVGFAIQ